MFVIGVGLDAPISRDKGEACAISRVDDARFRALCAPASKHPCCCADVSRCMQADVLDVRSRLYRAMTRAQMMVMIVNESLKGGWPGCAPPPSTLRCLCISSHEPVLAILVD